MLKDHGLTPICMFLLKVRRQRHVPVKASTLRPSLVWIRHRKAPAASSVGETAEAAASTMMSAPSGATAQSDHCRTTSRGLGRTFSPPEAATAPDNAPPNSANSPGSSNNGRDPRRWRSSSALCRSALRRIAPRSSAHHVVWVIVS